jgi:hypothetical protein
VAFFDDEWFFRIYALLRAYIRLLLFGAFIGKMKAKMGFKCNLPLI